MENKTVSPDVEISHEGSIVMVRPCTNAARDFVDQRVDVPQWAWLDGAFAVEHRCAGALVEGLM